MEDKNKQESINIFEKEISKLPLELKDKLLSQEKYIKEIVDLINKKAPKHVIGFYINAKIENQNNVPVPNFENLTLNFLLDDFENPIPQFNAKLLFGDKFDELLIEEKKKMNIMKNILSIN